jgi:SAM-dependent methyltransferase
MIKRVIAQPVLPIARGGCHAMMGVYYDARLSLLQRRMLRRSGLHRKPYELFSGVDDRFWLWLCTEGRRRAPSVGRLLPGLPNEDVQLMFTGNTGDAVLSEGFSAYRLFKSLYETYVGPLAQCDYVLDFGCGWGRIIRFFLKDLEPARLWGADPVEEMIEFCKATNYWCKFYVIQRSPPSQFRASTFDFIYSFSVFSHLSEPMQLSWLAELHRVLKPGGILIATTRDRDFIPWCADLRRRADLDAMHPGPRSSAAAFPDTERALAEYDAGKYCFSQLVQEGDWSYWGEAAISKGYVLREWTKWFTPLEYIDDRSRCIQNVIVVRK